MTDSSTRGPSRLAVPTLRTKADYFAAYTLSPRDPAAKPEDWLTQSLRPFNTWNQQELTEPYLKTALAQLPEIKRDRKIFFLGAWLAAFLGGQTSATALDDVHAWLAQPNIDPGPSPQSCLKMPTNLGARSAFERNFRNNGTASDRLLFTTSRPQND